MYQQRTYRELMKREGMTSFTVRYKDTDLWISIDKESYTPGLKSLVYSWIKDVRTELEAYIARNKEFATSLEPLKDDENAPPIARKMLQACQPAMVGPLASVAGAFSQEVGEKIILEGKAREIIVENGGDIYINVRKELTVGIFAGQSPLSNKVGFRVTSDKMPVGICTSAGTVGHSLSYGKADAVVITSPSAIYADAYATAVGNKIITPDDIDEALEWARKLPHITGVIAIVGDKLGVWGDITLTPLINRI